MPAQASPSQPKPFLTGNMGSSWDQVDIIGINLGSTCDQLVITLVSLGSTFWSGSPSEPKQVQASQSEPKRAKASHHDELVNWWCNSSKRVKSDSKITSLMPAANQRSWGRRHWINISLKALSNQIAAGA
jgi:hypothetical protein